MKQKKETHAQSHCERSVAIARLSNCTSDAITTQTSFARNDKRRAFTLAEGATHVGTCDNVRKSAFTLAEVLITLAIIGVVAAMTIPTLVANYNKKTIETRLLRSYSAINQAIKLSTVYNGDTQTWDSDISKASSIWTYDELETWFNKYLAPHIKYLKIDKHTFSYENSNGDTTNDERLLVYLSDGSILLLQSINPYDCGIIVSGNVNNAVDGKDLFAFRFESNNGANLSFVPYAPELYFDGSIESAKNAQRYGCYKETRMLCTKLIQLNGWKIPDDYPYIK